MTVVYKIAMLLNSSYWACKLALVLAIGEGMIFGINWVQLQAMMSINIWLSILAWHFKYIHTCRAVLNQILFWFLISTWNKCWRIWIVAGKEFDAKPTRLRLDQLSEEPCCWFFGHCKSVAIGNMQNSREDTASSPSSAVEATTLQKCVQN